jgi:TRAP-type C4-dicarboxylate transport system substrate-binding protein
VADVIWTLPGSTPGRFPRMEVFELPFLMSNAEATSAAVWDYYDKHARDEFKDTKVIALHTHGPGNIFTAKKQVKTIEDLKGLKLRGPTRPVTRLLASLGATPVGMPLPGVPEALSKGVIDGAVTTYEVSPVIKLDELAHFTSETDPSVPGLYTALFVTAMNKARYEGLPPDLRAVIDRHSGREVSIRFGRMMADNDVPGKARIVAKHTMYTIPKTELVRWQKASENVDDEWMAEVTQKGLDGKALLADARALIAKNTRK